MVYYAMTENLNKSCASFYYPFLVLHAQCLYYNVSSIMKETVPPLLQWSPTWAFTLLCLQPFILQITVRVTIIITYIIVYVCIVHYDCGLYMSFDILLYFIFNHIEHVTFLCRSF